MPRIAQQIQASLTEKRQLQRLANGRAVAKQLTQRAQIILACLDARENREIAQKLSVCEQTVAKWRERFAKYRLEGLQDSSRARAPKIYGSAFKCKLLKTLELPPPKGQSCWDGGALASILGVPKHAVWSTLRREGIQLQRSRSWCVSTDKQFASKSADVIGLYLAPPENALVLCVDEKPSIQALERSRGYVKTSSKKIVRGLQSTYKRHGTLGSMKK